MSILLLTDEERNDKKKEELEKLIQLATDVSAKVHDLNKEIESSKWKSLLSIFLLVLVVLTAFFVLSSTYRSGAITTSLYEQMLNILIISALFFSFLVVFFSAKLRKQITTAKQDLFSEELILTKLLDMIDSYKSLIEFSIVEKAVVDMRLQRIKFSTSKTKPTSSTKNKQDIPVSIQQP